MTRTVKTLVEGLDHPEGVAWSPRGHLYAGGESGQIYRVTLDGSWEHVGDTGGFVLGVTVDADDNVYACDPERGALLRIDPGSGAVEVVSAGTAEHPLRTPNFSAFGPDGALYLTDSGTWDGDDGLVFRVDPSGRTEVWTEEARAFPNGCCLGPDGRSLLVVESTLPGVSRIPIGDDGRAGAREVVVALPETVPDGVALDASGGLYVSCYRPDRIYHLSAPGDLRIFAEDPRGTVLAAPTNLAFAGEDLGSLVVANLGRWHLSVTAVEVRGRPLHYPTFT